MNNISENIGNIRPKTNPINRRTFLKQSGAVFILGLYTGCDNTAKVLNESAMPLPGTFDDAEFNPNVFVALNKSGEVFIICSRSEMGQGVRTSVPMIIADEMDADWAKVTVIQGDGDARYGNQNTDGSTSIRKLFDQWRTAGAIARQMLLQAAAFKWGVNADQCDMALHQVVNKNTSATLNFGELAEIASTLPVPEVADFKPKSAWRYIGMALDGIDNYDIVTGAAQFGADVELPNMVYASIERCPVLGGKVKSLNAEKTKKQYGVLDIVAMPELTFPVEFKPWGGVAVVAENTWAAMQARKSLEIEWDRGSLAELDSTKIRNQMRKNVNKPGKSIRSEGNIQDAFKNADKTFEAEYLTPMMAHAPMEPCACLAWVKQDGSCEIWAPTQTPQAAQKHTAKFLGIDESQVTVHVTLLGGAFGRKAKADFILEAVHIAKSVGKPVRLQWTREDDIRFSYYHAPSVQYVKASVDAAGKITGWLHRTAFPGIKSTFEAGATYPNSWELGGGFSSNRYDIPAMQLENCEAQSHVRIGWFRSVASNQHAFVVNAFTAECAMATKQDLKTVFMNLLGGEKRDNTLQGDELKSHNYNAKRMRQVLATVCEDAQWGKTLPDNQAIGLAVHWSFNSYTAHAVHVAMEDKNIKILQVHTAIDCGIYINRDRVISQMEGGTLMGFCWALNHDITTHQGAVQQSNFHDYPMLRLNEVPDIKVRIIESGALPGGVGEPGITSAVPALTSAIMQITGKPIRQLPIKL